MLKLVEPGQNIGRRKRLMLHPKPKPDKYLRVEDLQQLPLFPERFKLDGLQIDCDISARHLFALPRVFKALNECFAFDPNKFEILIDRTNICVEDIEKLGARYNLNTSVTLSRIMLCINLIE